MVTEGKISRPQDRYRSSTGGEGEKIAEKKGGRVAILRKSLCRSQEEHGLTHAKKKV